MQARSNKGERGQAIIIMVIALVGLFGFAGLALDGGNLYTEQRRAQAAADNAVMAAAFQEMSGPKTNAQLTTAAFDNAAINKYVNDSQTVILFHRPPIHGPYANNNSYLEVEITRRVNTALIHLVYRQNPVPLTVIAVAHGVPALPLLNSYAISAMKAGCGGGSTISVIGDGGGSAGGTFLYGGGAFVNASCDDALDMTGGNSLLTDGADIDVVGGANGTLCTSTNPSVPNNCNFFPAPATGVPTQTQDPIANSPAGVPPPCGPARNLATEMSDFDGPIIRPGSYTTLDPGSSFNSTLIMAPGIAGVDLPVYCLTGGKMSPGGGDIDGQGVLLYMTDEPTRIDASGDSDQVIRMTAPTKASTGCVDVSDTSQDICKYLNIVVYKTAGSNNCDSTSDIEIDFTGQTQKFVEGLIYAPNSMVRFGGQGGITMIGQTIAACVKFNGNGRIEIYFDPTVTYSPPATVTLDQ